MTDSGAAPREAATLLEIGRVTRPHGIRGEVRVQLHWAESDALEAVDAVWLGKSLATAVRYDVQHARRSNKVYLLKLAPIGDCDAAERLRGQLLWVERSELPPLAADEYYLSDLVGVTVLDPEGTALGVVIEVRPYPSADAMLISTPDGAQLEQVIADAFIDEVDIAQRRVKLASLDGLIETSAAKQDE